MSYVETSPPLPPLAEHLARLSPRQAQVYRLARSGFITKEIAERLSIAYHTATEHRKIIGRKLGKRWVSANPKPDSSL